MSTASAHYPATLVIEPLARSFAVRIQVPGSKSITNRALILAALGSKERRRELLGCLHSEDTEVMIAALRQLGFSVEIHGTGSEEVVSVQRGEGPLIPATSASLHLANSGTSIRFLTALVSLGTGTYRLDGIARMRERPIEDLLTALRQLGIQASSEAGTGCPPVRVEGGGWKGGQVRIRANVSSQFLSALLLVAPFAPADTELILDGTLVSEPYVRMTVQMMRQWGLAVEERPGAYHIRGQQTPAANVSSRYRIEPDASGASYFFAAAAITGSRVTIPGLDASSLQGDLRFVEVLRAMGCQVTQEAGATTVQGQALQGVDVDMNDISDTVMTLGAVACFAQGPTTIRNVAHIRHKETDRLVALATELRRVGAQVEERADGLTITPAPLHGARIETYNDHRMAMSLALVGLRVPGIVIKNPGCVSKTYPAFFSDWQQLYRPERQEN